MNGDRVAETVAGKSRHFLLLQGPCGPVFRQLQRLLRAQGQQCTRIAFNGGDFVQGGPWGCRLYRGSLDGWVKWLLALHGRRGFTDLIVYGDCRPYHRQAIAALRQKGVAVHILEEGYLRPHWITCEPDGVNGYSALAGLDLAQVDEAKLQPLIGRPEGSFESAQWRYMLHGFSYYALTWLLTPLFPRYVSHRELSIVGEAVLWVGRLESWPRRRRETAKALARLDQLGKPIHLVLLQLDGDSQVKVHSSFESIQAFIEHCVVEFAAGGSSETVLVFKNHPLDQGVLDRAAVIHAAARRHGLADRVFFIETGKLVPLLDRTISVTAINSTACHQSLRRGIPTMVLGKAVFNHPEIVPRMRLADFYRLRPVSGTADYEKLVALLRQTSQIFGGFYSRAARKLVLPALASRLIDGGSRVGDFVTPAHQAESRPSLRRS